MGTIDLDRFRSTPLIREPFDYLIVPGFVTGEARQELQRDFPRITEPGSFPVRALHAGTAFRQLIHEVQSPELSVAFGAKFGIDLQTLPRVLTVRGQSGPRDGSIHTDLPGKIITVLIYLNEDWQDDGGRLRLLRSGHDLEDVVAEVPPVGGTLLAFRRSDNSWHGHRPFVGERRVLQMNWVTPRHRRALRRAEMRDAFSSLVRGFFRLAGV